MYWQVKYRGIIGINRYQTEIYANIYMNYTDNIYENAI